MRDGWVSKIDLDGNLVWAAQLAGPKDAQVFAVATDGDEVYATGEFDGAADLDPGPGTFELGAPLASGQLFVWKLSADGNLLWARALLGTGRGVVATSGSHVLVAGSFRGTVDFDPGPEIRR